MVEKKKRIAQDNAEDGLPVVPSISNIDDLTDLPADFSGNFGFPESFPESGRTEPEAILEIPSFLGLDTLDLTKAVIQTVHDFPEDSLDSLRKLPEVPDYVNGEFSQEQQIPSILNFCTESSQAEQEIIPE